MKKKFDIKEELRKHRDYYPEHADKVDEEIIAEFDRLTEEVIRLRQEAKMNSETIFELTNDLGLIQRGSERMTKEELELVEKYLQENAHCENCEHWHPGPDMWTEDYGECQAGYCAPFGHIWSSEELVTKRDYGCIFISVKKVEE